MSVKIGSGQINGLQKSLLDFQKMKIADVKKELFEIKSDKKEISEDALNLKNIDADKSDVVLNNQQIDFNFVFNIFVQAELKIEGFVKTDEKILEASFTYMFQKDVVFAGMVAPKNYVLNMKMKAAFEEIVAYDKNINREDILEFIERLVVNIFDSFNDPANSLQTVFINQNNLKAIAKADKEDLARLIQSLLGSVFSFMKFKDVKSRDNPKINLNIIADATKHESKEYMVKTLQSFSVEINRLDAKEITG